MVIFRLNKKYYRFVLNFVSYKGYAFYQILHNDKQKEQNTAILPNNTKEWDNLRCVEDMYDEYGLINYIIKLHKQTTAVYFMVRDLEYRYRGYHL